MGENFTIRSLAEVAAEMDGPWVSVSYCAGDDWFIRTYGPKPITRYVYPNRREALNAKRIIDDIGCGGGCKRWHVVEKALPKERHRASYDIERSRYARYGCVIPPEFRLPRERQELQKSPRQKPVEPKIPTPSARATAGIVYILLAEGTTRVKIGRTSAASLRFETLRTASPYPLRLLREIHTRNIVALERLLHRRYATYRQYREWFDLPAEVLAQLLREEFSS